MHSPGPSCLTTIAKENCKLKIAKRLQCLLLPLPALSKVEL